MTELSRIDNIDGIYLKRNDLLEYGGCYGGKAECIYDILTHAGNKTFVTCGSRDSLQCEIVSAMCDKLGYECHVFLPMGADTKSILRMREHQGTTLHPICDGRMVVVKKRAADFADNNALTFIPFGLQSAASVSVVGRQVQNIPKEVKRIVVPVGGGATLCGVLNGLEWIERYDVKVLGVLTGVNPVKTIKRFAPIFSKVEYDLVPCSDGTPTQRYTMRADCSIGDVKLDAVYEGKCAPFLKQGDLLWIVGYHEV